MYVEVWGSASKTGTTASSRLPRVAGGYESTKPCKASLMPTRALEPATNTKDLCDLTPDSGAEKQEEAPKVKWTEVQMWCTDIPWPTTLRTCQAQPGHNRPDTKRHHDQRASRQPFPLQLHVAPGFYGSGVSCQDKLILTTTGPYHRFRLSRQAC